MLLKRQSSRVSVREHKSKNPSIMNMNSLNISQSKYSSSSVQSKIDRMIQKQHYKDQKVQKKFSDSSLRIKRSLSKFEPKDQQVMMGSNQNNVIIKYPKRQIKRSLFFSQQELQSQVNSIKIHNNNNKIKSKSKNSAMIKTIQSKIITSSEDENNESINSNLLSQAVKSSKKIIKKPSLSKCQRQSQSLCLSNRTFNNNNNNNTICLIKYLNLDQQSQKENNEDNIKTQRKLLSSKDSLISKQLKELKFLMENQSLIRSKETKQKIKNVFNGKKIQRNLEQSNSCNDPQMYFSQNISNVSYKQNLNQYNKNTHSRELNAMKKSKLQQKKSKRQLQELVLIHEMKQYLIQKSKTKNYP